MENKEIWKPIKGYEGYYEVSNLGRVRSVERIVERKDGSIRRYKGKILSPCFPHGYAHVNLARNGKYKSVKVHRLVAESFIPNPNNYSEINHKNEIKDDNRVSNLEWCSRKYNCNYGNRASKFIQSKSKEIVQLTLEGDYISKYKSIKEASEVLHNSSIGNALRGNYIQAAGYCWVYKDEYERYFR